jgi:putative FmdB family regulatory protein
VPTYQYTCTECGEPLEAVQSFTDAALSVCPRCGGQLRKVFSAVGVVFKGSGFYRTDSRPKESVGSKDSGSKDSGSKDSGSGSKDSGGSSDSGSKDSGSSSDSGTTKDAPAAKGNKRDKSSGPATPAAKPAPAPAGSSTGSTSA